MKDREPNKRSNSTVVQARDEQLAAEANEWARDQVRRWFEQHKDGFFTAADILVGLDERPDAPPAWLRWLSEYQTRYGMVRNALVSLDKRGFVETRQERNALGREATGYQRAKHLDDWAVEVEGGASERVAELVRGWLRTQPRELKNVEAISITRRARRETGR